jgi:hypothetical protein
VSLFAPAYSDHCPNPIDRDLITNKQKYSPAMLDLLSSSAHLSHMEKPGRLD